ncbi:MAG: (2Fe-2S)-binding protein, partial [Syntrophobacteraceae bacterium]
GERMKLEEKAHFISERPGRDRYFFELSPEEKSDLIAGDPLYGEVVCRCEQITKREIIDAIRNPLGVKTVSAVKYRARAMMGRCQGGFCLPRIVQIMREEFGFEPEDYLLRGGKSALFTGYVRDRKCCHA